MGKYFFASFYILIISWAIISRFYLINQVPTSLYWDETAILIDAKTIAFNFRDMHGLSAGQTIFPSYGDYKLPVYIWISAFFVKLTQMPELSIKLPSLLAGVLGTALSGFLFLKILSHKENLTPLDQKLLILSTSFVMASSVWSFMFSRVGFEGHLAQFFLFSSVMALFYQSKSKFLIYLSIIFGTVASYTYFSALIIFPVVFISSQFFYHGQKIKIVDLVLPLFLYILLMMPMFNSPFYQDMNKFRLSTSSIMNSQTYLSKSQDLRAKYGDNLLIKAISHPQLLKSRTFVSQLFDHLSLNYLFVNSDNNLRHATTQHGLFLLPFLPLMILGWYQLAKKYLSVLLLLSAWWLISLVPASIPLDTPHALRSINALTPISFMIAFGLYSYLKYLFQLPNLYKMSLLGLSFLIFIFFQFQFYYHYFNVYAVQSDSAWQGGYRQAAEVFYQYQDQIDCFHWNMADDKFFLWLMLYSPENSSYLQQLPERNYQKQIEAFDKYNPHHFQSFDLLGGNISKAMIVANKKEIANLKEMNDFQILQEQTLSRDGNLEMILVQRQP